MLIFPKLDLFCLQHYLAGDLNPQSPFFPPFSPRRCAGGCAVGWVGVWLLSGANPPHHLEKQNSDPRTVLKMRARGGFIHVQIHLVPSYSQYPSQQCPTAG